ncbi:MAG: hypothetical protein F6K30_25350 [Cyanothece sp. SIO2G6]|nr:hypothetical protein [Cyanothece sp. SIO2G6]
MAESIRSGETIRPLSVGNVVSASVQLYRNRIGEYFPLAAFAYLWLFVPVYGWAKFCMISGLISRLAFGELADQAETVPQARAKVKGNLWRFLSIAFQIFWRFLGIYILGIILLFIAGAFLGFVLSFISPVLTFIAVALLYIVFIFIIIRFFSRWFVAEVPLAVEPRITGTESIKRSWALTEQSVGRLQLVAVIAFMITIPVTLLTGYLPLIVEFVLPDLAASGAFNVISFLLSIAGGMLLLPFWQVIKAVIYYDLRSRQEGLDLELRDRPLTDEF